MNSIPLQTLRQAKKNLKNAGYTLSGWSRARGLKKDTVSKFFEGKFGRTGTGPVTSRIIHELNVDGFWPMEQKNRRAA